MTGSNRVVVTRKETKSNIITRIRLTNKQNEQANKQMKKAMCHKTEKPHAEPNRQQIDTTAQIEE